MVREETSGSEVPAARKRRFTKRRIVLVAALTLVVAGGAVASVTAVGEGSKRARPVRRAVVGPRDLAVASAYLGVSEEQLASDLRSGRSLAQVANSTPGRSSSGLVAALVSAKRERLNAIGTSVPDRVSAEVHRSGPGSVRTGKRRLRAGAAGLSSGSGRLGEAAAGYLGMSPAQLQSELRSGHTLAQVAATKGKSTSGLISALVAAKRQSLTSGLRAGRLAPERARSIEARLLRRVTQLVSRSFSRG